MKVRQTFLIAISCYLNLKQIILTYLQLGLDMSNNLNQGCSMTFSLKLGSEIILLDSLNNGCKLFFWLSRPLFYVLGDENSRPFYFLSLCLLLSPSSLNSNKKFLFTHATTYHRILYKSSFDRLQYCVFWPFLWLFLKLLGSKMLVPD